MKTFADLRRAEYRAQMRHLAMAYRSYIHPSAFTDLPGNFVHLTTSAAVMLACAVKARKLAQGEGA